MSKSRYRIIEIDDICPWQVQRRYWFFFWKDVCLSFSSCYSANNHVKELIEKEKLVAKNKK